MCVWFPRSATAGMKYVGTTFIVGKISTGGRCTICKDYPGRTQIDRDVLHMSTTRYDYGFYQVDWRMTSRGPLVKKGIFRFFPFHTGNSVSNKIFRDSVRDSAIAEIDGHYN